MEYDTDDPVVKININGRMFECLETTLQTFPESRLARRLRDDSQRKKTFYYDRSALMFEHVLDSYRSGRIHFPKDVCPCRFREELEFWGISDEDVAVCCWKTICKADDASHTMVTMQSHVTTTTKSCDPEGSSLGEKIWLIIENPHSSRIAYAWAVLIAIVIGTSVIGTALQTVDTFQRNATESEREALAFFRGKDGLSETNGRSYRLGHQALYIMDMVCFIVLTLEMLLRFVTCPDRRDLARSIMYWMEAVSCVAFWCSLVMNVHIVNINTRFLTWVWVVTNYLTILKLIRLFRIARHMTAFRLFSLTLYTSQQEFGIFIIFLSLLTCLFGYSMYAAEYFVESQFDTVFPALYWAVVTLTTVGYGDYTPSSAVGQVIASLCALCGILVLAMPAGIIVANFHSYYAHHLYVKRYISSYKTPPS